MNTETELFPEDTNEENRDIHETVIQDPLPETGSGLDNESGKLSLEDILKHIPSAEDIKYLANVQKSRMSQLEELNRKLYADNRRYADILAGTSEDELLVDIIQLYMEIGFQAKAIEHEEDTGAWRSMYSLIPRRIADLLFEHDVEEYTPEPGPMDPKLMEIVGTVHTDDLGQIRHVAEVKMPGFIKHIHKDNGEYQVRALKKAKVIVYKS